MSLGTLLSATIAALAVAGGRAPPPVAPPGLDAAVRMQARRFLRDRCHVGLSIVVRVDGADHLYGYGAVRRGGRRPTPASIYEIASVTKTFTGALAARALIERRLDLDGDFRRHLPGRYPGLERDGRPITLRTLATHTSGLPRDIPAMEDLYARPDRDALGAAIIARERGYGRVRTLAALTRTGLRSTPGATFLYSNLGIKVIGYGLAKAYGEPYADLLRRMILRRLGMGETGFALGMPARDRLVTAYGPGGTVQPYHDDTAGAAYGLYSTPRDMARYLAWQLDERDPVIARAHRPIGVGDGNRQALSWSVGQDGAARMLWHGGGSFGMTSQMLLYPDAREGYVLLANDACAGTENRLKAMAMAIHRRLARRTG